MTRMDSKWKVTVILAIMLFSFFGVALIASAQMVDAQPSSSLIGNLETIVSAVNYASSIDAVYQGMMVGKATMQQLVNAYNSLANPTAILQWTPIMSKLGYSNQTTVEWALDNQQMMSNGLPDTGADSLTGSPQSYLVYDRFLVLAYGYALQYSYDLTKWNLTKAYATFREAVDSANYPALLWVDQNGVGSTISYGPRYYDECGETIDCFLDFYNLGINSALNDALATWIWTNNNLWSGTNYNYALSWAGYECEAGGFFQIALKLWHDDKELPDAQRLLQDIENRFLQEQWLSPQWTQTLGGPSSYVVVHMASGNSELRLENTVMAWAAILGSYGDLNSTYQSDVQSMLTGATSAWQELLQSPLCGSAFPYFQYHSDSGVSNDATATGADLLFMLGIVPETAVLAVPVEENSYQYIYNMLDPELFNINLSTNIVTISLSEAGTLDFQLNQTVTASFPTPGIYSVRFSPDWNIIQGTTFISALPCNRQYVFSILPTGSTPSTITVSPATASLTDASSVNFTAVATGANGNTWDVTSVASWSISSGAGGSWSGSTYFPGKLGNWTVTASYAGVQSSAQVSIYSPIDFYHNDTINFNDVVYFVGAYINYYQTDVLNPACDLNHDGVLNFNDVVLFVGYYQAYYKAQ